MHTSTSSRRSTIAFCALLSVFLSACSGGCTSKPTTHDALALCLEDRAASDCQSSDYRSLSEPQPILVKAANAQGHPLVNASVTITITGANHRVDRIVTDSKGVAQDSYTATAPGTDAVSASLAGSSNVTSSTDSVMWIKPTAVVHPIIVVHGFNENAADYAVQLDRSLPASVHPSCTDLSCESWSPLLGTLANLYPDNAIETFCYIDDKAWSTAPDACHSSLPIPCPSGSNCINNSCVGNSCESESSVFDNALELSQMVNSLRQQTGKPVTLIGYSMGGAIIRTFLADCQAANPHAECTGVDTDVNQAIFLNAAHQGAWFLTPGSDFLTIPGVNTLPFQSVLSFFTDALKKLTPFDLGSQAVKDLTPRSGNIIQQNSSPDPLGVKFNNFSSDISIKLDVSLLGYQLPGTVTLPLGDLVMLDQDGTYSGAPQYGGEAFCPGCPSTFGANGYRQSSQSQEWQVSHAYEINIADVVNDGKGFKAILSSPISHLNISQPASLEPTTQIRVYDSTGLWGNQMVTIPQEVLAILYQSDGLTFS